MTRKPVPMDEVIQVLQVMTFVSVSQIKMYYEKHDRIIYPHVMRVIGTVLIGRYVGNVYFLLWKNVVTTRRQKYPVKLKQT